eukprot:TRINITY_DN97737_c0_g1_i1.p1 TRINITY_DN97737_c0_g1~~TRINITY_DN97737_c0_g1_i1.p1  ORF type:complete len:434 (-),score=76.13 TRINITY_DN97737_c0_g1_i1:77-1345(-)
MEIASMLCENLSSGLNVYSLERRIFDLERVVAVIPALQRQLAEQGRLIQLLQEQLAQSAPPLSTTDNEAAEEAEEKDSDDKPNDYDDSETAADRMLVAPVPPTVVLGSPFGQPPPQPQKGSVPQQWFGVHAVAASDWPHSPSRAATLVYASNYVANRIVRVACDAKTGSVLQSSEGHGPQEYSLRCPTSLHVSPFPELTLLAAETGHQCVKAIALSDQGKPMQPKLVARAVRHPSGIAVAPNGDVFVCVRAENSVIRCQKCSGTIDTIITDLDQPTGVCLLRDQSIVVCEKGTHQVKLWPSTGGSGDTGLLLLGNPNGRSGRSPAELDVPYAVAVDQATMSLLVVDHNNNRVQRIPAPRSFRAAAKRQQGNPASAVTVAGRRDGRAGSGPTELNNPTDAMVSQGNLYVADTMNYRVVRVPLV